MHGVGISFLPYRLTRDLFLEKMIGLIFDNRLVYIALPFKYRQN